MPTYEYICDDCQHEFETFHSMKSEPLKDCPECNEPALRRKIGTGAGIIFKGSGWYQTDFKNNGKQPEAKKDSSNGGDTKPAAEKKAETPKEPKKTEAPKEG